MPRLSPGEAEASTLANVVREGLGYARWCNSMARSGENARDASSGRRYGSGARQRRVRKPRG